MVAMIRTLALVCALAASGHGQITASATPVGTGCGGSFSVFLAAPYLPVLGTNFYFFSGSSFGGTVHVFWAVGPATAGTSLGFGGCNTYLDLASLQSLYLAGLEPLTTFGTFGGLAASGPVPIPNDPSLAGFTVTTQAVMFASYGLVTPIGTILISNALQLQLGY